MEQQTDVATQHQAFPLMNQLENGALNPYPELTVMRPAASTRDSQEGQQHPADIVDLSSQVNYYKYPWMEEAEGMSAINYAMLASFGLVIAICTYLVAGTKLIKFVQFFIARQHYQHLKIDIQDKASTPQPLQSTDNTVIYQTPRPNLAPLASKTSSSTPLLQVRRSSGLASNLSFHASSLMQFYAPLFALCQIAMRSKTLVMPNFIIWSQLCFRAALLLTLTVATSLIYVNTSVEKLSRACMLDRDQKSASYNCLNEYEAIGVSSHQKMLILLGSVSAFLASALMFLFSQSLFKNYQGYLTLFAGSAPEKTGAEADDSQKKSGFVSKLSISSVGQVEALKQQKSPTKKRRKSKSPRKHQRKNDSVASLRNLFDRESDSSMLPFQTDNGYDSAAQMSMSTQANALNLSERGTLLNQSANSAREIASINGAAAALAKKQPQGNAVLDLLPIDEDIDEQQCSPIKPKKRTKVDSPFKRHQNGNFEISSSDLESQHQSKPNVAVRGFGEELDDGHKDGSKEFQLSLDVNSHIATPLNKDGSEGLMESKKSLDPICNGSQSAESGFHLEVERVDNKQDRCGLKTVNSGPSNKQTETETMNKPTCAGGSSRNHPSLNIGSFGANSESTLQLDTIAPLKPSNLLSSANGPDSSKDDGILSDIKDQEAGPQPQSTKNGAAISLVTPFVMKNEITYNSGNEIQTDDKNSIGITYGRNIEAISSDGVSNQDSMRPDSNQGRRQRRRIIADELLKDFKVEKDMMVEGAKTEGFAQCKAVCFVIFVMAFMFGLCLDAYFLHSLPAEGLMFIAWGLLAAVVADTLLQALLLLVLSAVQFGYELRGKALPLDTSVLCRMTTQRRDLALLVFRKFQEQSALLKVDYQDEEDLLLESLDGPDIERQGDDLSSRDSSQRIGAKDVLTKDTAFSIQVDGISVSVSQTLRFCPPEQAAKTASTALNSKIDINIVQPRISVEMVEPKSGELRIGKVSSFVDAISTDQNQEQDALRKKRRPEISKFERTQQFFAAADIKSNSKRRLRGSHQKESPSEKNAQMLRQSIENIELDKLEGDFPAKDSATRKQRGQSKTPDKLKEEAKSSLLYSSNKKVSQFETPKGPSQLSQVKLKQTTTLQNNGEYSAAAGKSSQKGQNEDGRSDKQSDVRRRLVMPKASIASIGGSMEDVRKLSSQKKYLEDRNGQDIVGLMLSNSSQSVFHIEAGKETLEEDPYASKDIGYCSQERPEKGAGGPNKQDMYSPIFSSVNRKAGRKIDQIKPGQPLKDGEEAKVTNFTGLNMAGIHDQVEKGIYTRQPTASVDLNGGSGPTDSACKTGGAGGSSSNRKMVNQMLSHQEAFSKQQSFNSPRSLHEQLQLTSEKLNNSIEGSSIHKGRRRKMVMLDEAGVSKQSLQFGGANGSQVYNNGGGVNNSQSIGDNNSMMLVGVPFNNSGSMCGNSSSGTTTPLRKGEAAPGGQANMSVVDNVARHNSMVLFEDQGQPDFQNEQLIEDGDDDKSKAETQLVFGGVESTKMPSFKPRNAKTGRGDSQGGSNGVATSSELDKAVIKRASIHSQVIEQAKDGDGRSNLQVSTEKRGSETAADARSQTTQTAFQRLVMASKRIVAKKSSEKRESVFKAQMRSQSQCDADTISIMKEQGNNAKKNTTPLTVTKRNSRSSSDPQNIQRKSENHKLGAKKTSGNSNKHTNSAKTGLKAIMQTSQEPTYRGGINRAAAMAANQDLQRRNQISVIKEQVSMEQDTPVISRITDIKKQPSGGFTVPNTFSKEQVDPVKVKAAGTPNQNYENQEDWLDEQLKSRISIRNGISVRDIGEHLAKQTDSVNKFVKNLKSRKSSQVSSKNGGEKKSGMLRRGSSKNSGSLQTGKQQAPRGVSDLSGQRENTLSSNISFLDFDKMDKQREEDFSDYSKMISNGSYYNRLEDQRRRLESFLSLAQQAKSKRDIVKIQDMIRQIDETGKPLPIHRINELKLLELMASPYNQSLIAMIQVELDMARKVKELKKQQNNLSSQNSKSKFALPKHIGLSNQNSRLNVNERLQIEDAKGKRHDSISGSIRSTTIVNIKTKQITSCRSNNDVAARHNKFNRSPSHLNASPISMGICQPVILSGNGGNKQRDGSLSKRDSSVGRYSYLRSVGNAVVNEDVRKSVDKIRISKESFGDNHISANDLIGEFQNTKFEQDGGRRGTTPNEFQPKGGMGYFRSPFELPAESSGQNSNVDILNAGRNDHANQQRSHTSYGQTQNQVSGIGLIKQGFIAARITPDIIQKSQAESTEAPYRVDDYEKENSQQPKYIQQP